MHYHGVSRFLLPWPWPCVPLPGPVSTTSTSAIVATLPVAALAIPVPIDVNLSPDSGGRLYSPASRVFLLGGRHRFSVAL